jgi:hypothetical protein
MRSPCCLCVFALIFVAARMCLPSRCLSTAVSSASSIPAFRRYVALLSDVVGHDVFYVVHVASDTPYVVIGK